MNQSSGQPTSTGTVKWFSMKKGFGFIEAENGEEVFVHYSSITGRGYRVLQPGDRVSFEKVPGPKGQQAFHVVVLSPQ
ncbi:cold shock domain-containing protein [bacterium]|nr:cold shock domain-containing protein [bacterium]MBU1985008.1 cold shock domain-containing protein [bacterium]